MYIIYATIATTMQKMDTRKPSFIGSVQSFMPYRAATTVMGNKRVAITFSHRLVSFCFLSLSSVMNWYSSSISPSRSFTLSFESNCFIRILYISMPWSWAVTYGKYTWFAKLIYSL